MDTRCIGHRSIWQLLYIFNLKYASENVGEEGDFEQEQIFKIDIIFFLVQHNYFKYHFVGDNFSSLITNPGNNTPPPTTLYPEVKQMGGYNGWIVASVGLNALLNEV